MRMRGIGLCAALLAAALCFAGCGGSGAVPHDNSDVKVGVAMPTRTLQRWNQDGAHLEIELRAQDFDADVEFAGGDAAKQAAQIAHMVDGGCRVLIVAAVDGAGLSSVLEQAKAKGVTVIAYDRLLMDTDAVDYYVTFDSFLIGRMQGQAIADGLGLADGDRPYTLEIATGPADDSNVKALFAGAMEVLQPYIDKGQLVVRSGETSAAQCATPGWASLMARERMAGILTRCYADAPPDAVLCANDSIALGVLEALKDDGCGTPERPLPLITGQDADIPNVKAMIAGEQTMSVFKDTRLLAAAAVKMAAAVGRKEAPEINSTKDFNNGRKTVPAHVLTGQLVEASNYKELLVDSGYYSAAELQ